MEQTSQSDAVSMSESSTNHTFKKGDASDVLMKKKLKVLKQALKEEKVEKVNIEQNLKKAVAEIDTLKAQVVEKDKKIKSQVQEK